MPTVADGEVQLEVLRDNASWDVVLLLIVYFFSPQTKGVNLEGIEAFFEGPQNIKANFEENAPKEADEGLMVKGGAKIATLSKK